ncbi:hypothetical protein CEXT_506481 [Caerostris extrusa]|uniref:Uncharacterized protein n=1 Tax=Caerostris extrusa TaxID=172846 RepID=A0AAV4QTB2_CAEEX|nr:hypothetical protein CEXT_506481 [Caerostris extrusa]
MVSIFGHAPSGIFQDLKKTFSLFLKPSRSNTAQHQLTQLLSSDATTQNNNEDSSLNIFEPILESNGNQLQKQKSQDRLQGKSREGCASRWAVQIGVEESLGIVLGHRIGRVAS